MDPSHLHGLGAATCTGNCGYFWIRSDHYSDFQQPIRYILAIYQAEPMYLCNLDHSWSSTVLFSTVMFAGVLIIIFAVFSVGVYVCKCCKVAYFTDCITVPLSRLFNRDPMFKQNLNCEYVVRTGQFLVQMWCVWGCSQPVLEGLFCLVGCPLLLFAIYSSFLFGLNFSQIWHSDPFSHRHVLLLYFFLFLSHIMTIGNF